jgi:predicted outer membrane repeat protein
MVEGSGGGAIHTLNSNVLINKSLFSKNISYYNGGGAIYAENSNLAIESSEISHNQAASIGGGAVCYTYYNHNNIIIYDNGLQLNNTILFENRADYGSGGAIEFEIGAYLSTIENVFIRINGTIIYENTANRGSRGAIHIERNSNIELDMHNIKVYSNRANNGNGGGIHIESHGQTIFNSRISIVQFQFINNTANQGSGGAII